MSLCYQCADWVWEWNYLSSKMWSFVICWILIAHFFFYPCPFFILAVDQTTPTNQRGQATSPETVQGLLVVLCCDGFCSGRIRWARTLISVCYVFISTSYNINARFCFPNHKIFSMFKVDVLKCCDCYRVDRVLWWMHLQVTIEIYFTTHTNKDIVSVWKRDRNTFLAFSISSINSNIIRHKRVQINY